MYNISFKNLRFLLFGIVIILSSFSSFGQSKLDNVLWSFTKFSFKIDEKWKSDITPIYRFNDDISQFQNASLDYSITRKITKRWNASALGRTWLIPNQRPRQFIWFYVNYNMPEFIPNLKISHNIKFHGALDINDREDPDFLRYKITTAYPLFDNRWRPFAAIEPFFQFNENNIQRWRSELGVNYSANNTINFIGFLRREDYIQKGKERALNIWMAGIQYKFLKPIYSKQKEPSTR